jgi:type II secretory pathway component GspD/PulD (secretin)
MKFRIFFLIMLLIPAYSFGQEDAEDGVAGPTIQAILEKSLPPNANRVIKVDSKTGTIIVRDTPTNQRKVAEILKDIDIGPQQITIESRFVELKLTDISELGINWGNTFLWYDYSRAPLNQRRETKMITGGQNPGSQGNLVTFSDTTAEGLSMQIARLRPIEFDLVIHALARSDKANLLSAPKITTINGQKANIQITRSVPYITDADLENIGTANRPIWRWDYTLEEEEVGITLVVTPRVGEDSKIITLELEPEIEVLSCRLSFISTNESLGWPVIDRRSTRTTVMVQSGETIVMGGLLDDRDDEVEQKVPILGDIPLLGNLFRHKYTKRIKKNLLIFVTASLINPEGEEIVD